MSVFWILGTFGMKVPLFANDFVTILIGTILGSDAKNVTRRPLKPSQVHGTSEAEVTFWSMQNSWAMDRFINTSNSIAACSLIFLVKSMYLFHKLMESYSFISKGREINYEECFGFGSKGCSGKSCNMRGLFRAVAGIIDVLFTFPYTLICTPCCPVIKIAKINKASNWRNNFVQKDVWTLFP